MTAPAEAEYLRAYEDSLGRWPVPYDEIDVDDRFGRTHVIASGARDAPPIVLLHGYGASSTMWAAGIRELARRHRVFAVDVLGQAGKSRPRAPLATRAQCVEWLSSVLDALGVARACIAGVSYGGWLTLACAIDAPARVRAAALVSPGGLLPLSRQMQLRAMLALVAPWQSVFDRVLMRWIGTREPIDDPYQRATAKLLARQLYLGLRVRGELARAGAPAVPFSDRELESLSVPTLLLVGDEEVLYDPREALARARRLVPGVVAELVPRTNHDLAVRRAELVADRLSSFFAKHEERRPIPAATGAPSAHSPV